MRSEYERAAESKARCERLAHLTPEKREQVRRAVMVDDDDDHTIARGLTVSVDTVHAMRDRLIELGVLVRPVQQRRPPRRKVDPRQLSLV